MEIDCIAFKETGYFSNIISDYLDGKSHLQNFYRYSPQLSNFKEVISNKKFDANYRLVLAKQLNLQYKNGGIKLVPSSKVLSNINLLEQSTTYTITTGHQLNLFTGPLYFLFKIASTIKLVQQLKHQNNQFDFVPVYWMASEDHDLEEINHFYYRGKKLTWNTQQKGAVGRMNLEGLEELYAEFAKALPEYSTTAEQLKNLFSTAYTKHKNLADATRYIAHQLFSDYGLVIIDGDNRELKQLFSSTIERELLTEFSSTAVSETNDQLAKIYKIQVNPREINLFYLKDNIRERIVRKGKEYHINNTSLHFSQAEILNELNQYPERFSPNVVLRPLYQETILPNLAYIGGGGELAYWFQFKSAFEKIDLPFPMLILRNSALVLNEKQTKYYRQLKLNLPLFFQDTGRLIKKWVVNRAGNDVLLAHEKKSLLSVYNELAQKVRQVDESLAPHVAALSAKAENALSKVSDQLIRSERRREAVAINKITQLKDELFPKGGLQERKENFSSIYLWMGEELIEELIQHFEVPAEQFTVFFNAAD